MTDTTGPRPIARRDALSAAGAGLALLAGSPAANAQRTADEPPDAMPVDLHVNGRDHRLELDPRTTLLDALRDHLGLTGAKPGCHAGTCGACTVHLDGRRQLSCLVLAAAASGQRHALRCSTP